MSYKFEIGDAAIYIDEDGFNHGWVSIVGREPGHDPGYWVTNRGNFIFVSEKYLYMAREVAILRKKNDEKKEMA